MTLGRAAVLQPFGFLAIEEIEIADPAGYEVAVEIFAASIRPADIALLARSDGPDWQPEVPGLEGAGYVTAVGSAATRVKVGDLVLIGPMPAAAGRAAVYPALTFESGAVQTGRPLSTWATNMLIDEQFLSPIPDKLRADRDGLGLLGDAALTATALVTQASNTTSGEALVISGSGGLALAALAAARAANARTIIAVAPHHTHAAATAAGATTCIESHDDLPATGPVRRIDCNEVTGGDTVKPGQFDRDAALATLFGWIDAGHFDPAVLVGKRYTIEQINEAVMELEGELLPGAGLLVMEPLK